MVPFEDESVQFLEGIGDVGLGVDKETHDLLLMVRTGMGIVNVSLTKERSLQLGIALIRHSGRTFRFTKPEVVGPPPESRQEKEDGSNDSSDGGAGGGSESDVGQPGGRGAGRQVDGREDIAGAGADVHEGGTR
jgi:hypothetical protein